MNKKAQITFFIIIGLVLLIGASIVIYLVTQKEAIKVEEIVYPSDIKLITDFITDCAKQAGLDALSILGSQGGYVRIPLTIANDASKFLSLDQYGIRKVPYWYAEGKTVIPSINFMENQIEEFVKTDLERCLGGFSEFEGRFEITALKELRVKTTVAEKDVLVEAVYPLKIKQKNQQKEHLVDRFVVVFPVMLKKMHDLASQIMFAENENSYLENATLSLMIVNPEIPMNGLTVDCKPQRWSIVDIKTELQDSLRLVIPKIRVKNTDYPSFIESQRVYERLGVTKMRLDKDQSEGDLACYVEGDELCKKLEESKYYPQDTPEDAWEYTHLFYDVNAEPTDLKISFQYYPEMGMEIFANPSRNGILSTSLMKGPRKYLSMLCVNAYHFVYTLNYPVKIGIRDDDAFNGQGYIFEFAFPVLIYDNMIKRKDFGIMNIPMFRPEDYCSDLGDTEYEFKAEGYYEEGLPGDINDVTISFNCGREYCVLGKTGARGGEYKLRTKIPQGCSLPYIEAEKQGYLKNGEYLTSPRLVIPIKKLNTLNYEVIKHPYSGASGVLSVDQNVPLRKDDKVMIYMRIMDEEYDQFKEYPCTECVIDFMDDSAKYDVDIFLERDGKIIGGYSAKDLEISSNEIGGKQTVVFHIYEYTPYPSTDEAQMRQAEYFTSKSYADMLRPEFK